MSTTTDTPIKKKQSPAVQRRGNKPLIEKRRRARINECLLQLKNLVLKATSSENSRTGKLEKADILEMTVEYLKKINTNQGVNLNIKEENGSNYSAGYEKCMEELVHFLDKTKGFNEDIKQKITKHCKNKLHERIQCPTVEQTERTDDETVSTTNPRLHEDTSDSDSDSAMDTRPSDPPSPTSLTVIPNVVNEIKIETNHDESMNTIQNCSPNTQHISGSIKLVCGGDILILMDQQTNTLQTGVQPGTQFIPILSRTHNSIPVQNILIPYKPPTELAQIPTYNLSSASNIPVLPFASMIPIADGNGSPAQVSPAYRVDSLSNVSNSQGMIPVWRPW